jgi:snapalysin
VAANAEAAEGGARRRGRVATLAVSAAAACVFVAAAAGGVLPSYADTDPAGQQPPEVVPIDLLLAGSYTDTAREAIEIWNRAVPSVRFVEQSTPAALRVEEIKSEDGHQTRVDAEGLGIGRVYFDTAKPELYEELGYTPLRIAMHELGHMLSLNDFRQAESCAKVMAAPGLDCANVQPDAAERAEVADYFAHHDLGDPMPDWPVDSGEGEMATPER